MDPFVNIDTLKMVEIIRKLILKQLLAKIRQIKGITVIMDQK